MMNARKIFASKKMVNCEFCTKVVRNDRLEAHQISHHQKELEEKKKRAMSMYFQPKSGKKSFETLQQEHSEKVNNFAISST